MRQGGRRQDPDDLVTATEVACFAYCPEQWRLQYGLELLPANKAALEAGTRHHARKAAAERLAAALGLAGRALMLLAALVLLLWLVSR